MLREKLEALNLTTTTFGVAINCIKDDLEDLREGTSDTPADVQIVINNAIRTLELSVDKLDKLAKLLIEEQVI